ncbi:MAG: hypothetical protein JWR72_3824 [Flavisolibacter sp.]|jgi:hypothetical protein|nr:hypothetical protein [Flavisolibacter sp.]
MYLQNDLLEAVPLDRERVSIPGYLGKIKRDLKEKYKETLAASAEAPEFLVVALSGHVPEINEEG